MKDKLTKYLVVTFCVVATLALFSTLEPWRVETFTDNTPTDAEICGGYEPYRGKDNILVCWCNGSQKAKPGKCK